MALTDGRRPLGRDCLIGLAFSILLLNAIVRWRILIWSCCNSGDARSVTPAGRPIMASCHGNNHRAISVYNVTTPWWNDQRGIVVLQYCGASRYESHADRSTTVSLHCRHLWLCDCYRHDAIIGRPA